MASPFGVYQESGLQLTKPYSLRKTCGSTGKKMGGTGPIWFDTEVKQSGIRLACYNTAILPILMPTHGHAHAHPTRMDHRTHLSQLCMKNNVHRYAHQHAMKLAKCKRAKTLIISKVQTCLPGSE